MSYQPGSLGDVPDLMGILDQVDEAVGDYRESGLARARAEYDYRTALRCLMVELREKGTPVTIIGDLCRGDDAVGLLRFQRDCADVVYGAAREALYATKLRARILDSQIGREWSAVRT